MTGKTILIVDDNADDFFAAHRVLDNEGLNNPLVHVADGQTALDYLRGAGAYAESPPPRPALVLLDINMPGMKGIEVLRLIRAEPGLRELPVIMLTSSDADRDVLDAMESGASAYLTKPLHLKSLLDGIARVQSHRLEVSLRLLPAPRQN